MKAVFNRSTGKFVGEKRYEFPAYDDALFIGIDTGSESPTPATKRWDGATGIRDSTQAELDADAASARMSVARESKDRLGSLDSVFDLSQVAGYLAILDQINVIRSRLVPPLSAITPKQALQAYKDKMDSLVS